MERLYIETPLLESLPLQKFVNGKVFLKMEALQPSGSFKNRGIGNLCKTYASSGAKKFISTSGGNAGLAASYSGLKLGIPTSVFVPVTTPEIMKSKLVLQGAEVIVHGANWNEADAFARDQVNEAEGVYYIPPYDHPLIWEGNASLVHEVAKTGLVPDAILVTVGGGGLFCGVMQGIQDLGWSNTDVYTVETFGTDSMAKSIQEGKLVTLAEIRSIATSLGAKTVGKNAFEWALEKRAIPQVVTDKSAVEACISFANDHRVLVEPACGAALSLIYDQVEVLQKYQSILVIVCGGSGVNLDLLEKWKVATK